MKTPNKLIVRKGKLHIWFQPFSIWLGFAYANIGNGNWVFDIYVPMLHIGFFNVNVQGEHLNG